MLASGRTSWSAGDRVRVYRAQSGAGRVIDDGGDESDDGARDYDVEHYARLLRESFAVRLERAFTPIDYEAVFADPNQMPLFAPVFTSMRTILSPHS